MAPIKVSSANIEFVFSDAGNLLANYHAINMLPSTIGLYIRVKNNWKIYVPSTEDIWDEYKLRFGKKCTKEDGTRDVVVEDSDDDSSDDDCEDDDGCPPLAVY